MIVKKTQRKKKVFYEQIFLSLPVCISLSNYALHVKILLNCIWMDECC